MCSDTSSTTDPTTGTTTDGGTTTGTDGDFCDGSGGLKVPGDDTCTGDIGKKTFLFAACSRLDAYSGRDYTLFLPMRTRINIGIISILMGCTGRVEEPESEPPLEPASPALIRVIESSGVGLAVDFDAVEAARREGRVPYWSARFDASLTVGSGSEFTLDISEAPSNCALAFSYSSAPGLQTVAALLGTPVPAINLLGVTLEDARARFGTPLSENERGAVWTGADASGRSAGALELKMSEEGDGKVVSVSFHAHQVGGLSACRTPPSSGTGARAAMPVLPTPEPLAHLLAPDGGLHVLTGDLADPNVGAGMSVTITAPPQGDTVQGWSASWRYLPAHDVTPEYTVLSATGTSVLLGERIVVFPEEREADLLHPSQRLQSVGPIHVVLRGRWPEASQIPSSDGAGVRKQLAARLDVDPRRLHIHVLGETGWTYAALFTRERREAWLLASGETISLPVELALQGRSHVTAFHWEGRNFIAFPAAAANPGQGGYVEVGAPDVMLLPQVR